MTATTWGIFQRPEYGWGVQQLRDEDGTIVSTHPETFDTLHAAHELAVRFNMQAMHYAALDLVVAEISAALDAQPDSTNYEAGGHAAYAVWLLPEDAAYAEGALLTAILDTTLDGCEFIVQPLGKPVTTSLDHYPFTKGA